MLIRSMIDYKLGNDANSTGVRLSNEVTKVRERAVIGMNIAVFANIVAIIQQGRGIEWQQPNGIYAKLGDVIEL